VTLADQAVALAHSFPSAAVRAMVLVRATETAILAADHQHAESTLNRLVELLRTIGTRRWAADTLEMGGLILERLGQVDDACAALTSADAARQFAGDTDDHHRLLTAELRQVRRRLQPELAAKNNRADPPEQAMRALHLALQTTTQPLSRTIAHSTDHEQVRPDVDDTSDVVP